MRRSTQMFMRAQSLSIRLFRYEFPTIAGIAMQSPRIVVESASATPRDMDSGEGVDSPVANTVTSPATVPSSPSQRRGGHHDVKREHSAFKPRYFKLRKGFQRLGVGVGVAVEKQNPADGRRQVALVLGDLSRKQGAGYLSRHHFRFPQRHEPFGYYIKSHERAEQERVQKYSRAFEDEFHALFEVREFRGGLGDFGFGVD